jgi:DNA-binding response OmpR family regulator
MTQHTILIVEDDDNQRALYQEEFHDEGYRVIAAADGKEAVAILREQRPDLAVLDINMPVMDGLDTLSHMLDAHNKMPIVINTAYASYQDSFTTWSADAYVVKSSDLTELKETVKRLLEERAG